MFSVLSGKSKKSNHESNVYEEYVNLYMNVGTKLSFYILYVFTYCMTPDLQFQDNQFIYKLTLFGFL